MEFVKITSDIIQETRNNYIIYYNISIWKKTDKLKEATDNPLFNKDLSETEKKRIIKNYLNYFP